MMDDVVECPQCGTVNGKGAETCRLCGEPLTHHHVAQPGSRLCAQCGKPVDGSGGICNACTRPARDVIMSNLPKEVSATECVHWSERPAAAGRSARVMMAGILILVAGSLGVGQAAVSLDPDLTESMMDAVEAAVPWAESVDEMLTEYAVLQVFVLVSSVIALAGGVFALTRTRFEFALIGGVFGMAAIGFLMGAFLALVGVLLLATSRKDFLPEC